MASQRRLAKGFFYLFKLRRRSREDRHSANGVSRSSAFDDEEMHALSALRGDLGTAWVGF